MTVPESKLEHSAELEAETGHLSQLKLDSEVADASEADATATDGVGSGEDEAPESTPTQPKGPTAKKRREDAAFQAWLETNQREVTKASKNNLERSSVSRLVEDSTNKKIIASPREYQIDLFEKAKQENTIVVLDTGSGKTLIAALLLRHTLEQELNNRSQGQPPKVAFFLVEKVALCFQQHAVLTCNLEFPIQKFYGEMTGVLRVKEFWDTQFAEHMAIVCTAQILFDLLSCGFIQMSQINLLIFDEAHHAKKNHPYARIIKEHYRRETGDKPRILGMTASPVDAHTTDIRAAAAELEGMLCSRIATISDAALIESQAHRQQTEIKEKYQRLEDPEVSRTALREMIARLVQENTQFKAHLEFTKKASSTLGTWCADRYWKLFMTDLEISKLEAKAERDATEFNVSARDAVMAAVRKVKDTISAYDIGNVEKDSLALSTKVRTLHAVLEDAFHKRLAKRCIVFVAERSTAILLSDLYRQPGMNIRGMTAGYMIGSNAPSHSAANMSFKDQIVSLQKFRYGETNCLFATSVAEEGIDIPECDVIIRFDLFASAIQYIQSKGRARQKSSLYITLMEEDNWMHERQVRQAMKDTHALRQFCSCLPEDRKVQDYVIDAAAVAQQAEHVTQKTFTVAETGARLTFITSLDVVAKFVSSLPASNEAGNSLEYIVTSMGKKFVARIMFPDTSPIKTASGEPQRTKQLARCSAAFEACVELIRKKYVDGHFQPVFAKKLPAMRNARLAIKSDKKSQYDMRVKPDFWSKDLGSMPTRLFPTIIRLDNSNVFGRVARPLVLLTRHPLPSIPTIPLFFGNGENSTARLYTSSNFLELSMGQVEALTHFTLRVFADVFSKEYSTSSEQVPYFVAPTNKSSHTEIDWDMVSRTHGTTELCWEDQPDSFFHDKFISDPWDGSRKFFTSGINKDLRPSDPTPEGVPPPKSLAYKKVEQNIKEYSNSLSIVSRKKRNWRDDQPVVNAEVLSMRRNFLDEFFVEEEVDMRCYIILEPLNVSPLPVDVVCMALVLPVILYRIDSTLIALEACSIFDLEIAPELALEALTKDSFNTEEHGEDQIDFQAGMGRNYERLEFLGDTFLKMATTISVFTLIPTGDEFEYHVERMVMLCNSNLFTHAVDRNLQAYIRTRAFNRRTWYPSNMTLQRGKASKMELSHSLSHKSIADVCEALIGAAYMTTCGGGSSGTSSNMDMAVKAVTAMVDSELHRMTAFDDYFAAFDPPEWHAKEATAVQRRTAEQVAQITGYRFESAPLLRSAFKHPSYTFEAVPDYQRLEFLGDALLDMAVVDFLFRRFPEADPKWLTEHKTAMVSNQFQGCLCVKLGLHKHILLATSSLLGDVREYVAQLEQAEQVEAAEAAAAAAVGLISTSQPSSPPPQCNTPVDASPASPAASPKPIWISVPHPPKALADVLEALVGAMFVDSRYDYSVVERFFRRFIQPYFEDMAQHDSHTTNSHAVTSLTHRLQGWAGCSRWRLHVAKVPPPVEAGVAVLADEELVCALMVHGRVVCHATGRNGSETKVAVAKMALETLADLTTVDQFRAGMGCDCGGGSGGGSGVVLRSLPPPCASAPAAA